jgi:colicin import membrane protein
MSEQLVLINPKDFEIDDSMANNITSKIVTLKKERDILSQKYLEVMQMDINDPETAKEAKKARLLIRDNRTKGFEAQRVADKKVPLRLGQFIDAVYGSETAENIRMEGALESIEKHAENLEKQRLEELQRERIKLAIPYVHEDFYFPDLSSMDQEVFDAYLQTKKNTFEARIAAEKKAEQERLERERIQNLHNERFQLLLPVWQFVEDKDANFGILTQEAFEYFLQSKEIQKVEFEKEQEQIRIENQKLREEAEKKEADAKKEREAQEAAMAKERKKAQEAAEKERKEKEALEAQLKKERDEKAAEEAKKQAELEKERLRLENLSKAGDKAILLDWINASFPTPKSPNGLTSDGNGKLLEIAQKFDGFKKWALTQIES